MNRRLSAIFLLVYAPTFSLASCDWLMLLDPMWFSTIWGVYNFAGMVQATLAAMIVLAIVLRARGPLRGIFTDDHLHDLGKLLLGFSCFWMYIWFSQYMLIWYTNMPEETSYYILRTQGPWGPLMIANVVLNWIVPFFILLPRPCKRSESVMMKSRRCRAARALGRPVFDGLSRDDRRDARFWALGTCRRRPLGWSVWLVVLPDLRQGIPGANRRSAAGRKSSLPLLSGIAGEHESEPCLLPRLLEVSDRQLSCQAS